MFVSTIVLPLFATFSVMKSAIPEEFLATWAYDKQEGFDAYLASKGVPWVIRKLIVVSGHVIKFEKIGGNKWCADHQAGKRGSKYEFFLEEEFTAKGFDQADHKIQFAMDGEALVESHQRIDKPDDPAEVYTYTIEDGRLVQAMKSGSASCKRYFKKKN